MDSSVRLPKNAGARGTGAMGAGARGTGARGAGARGTGGQKKLETADYPWWLLIYINHETGQSVL